MIRTLRPMLSLLLTLIIVFAAKAQFTGPTPRSNPSLNQPQVMTSDPSVLYPAAREVTLRNGDQITVRVLGPGDYTATVRVGADGRVVLPLLGEVELSGLTISAAQSLIADDLVRDQMFRDPQVQVTLVEGPNASVAVVGEVHGIVPLLGQRRLFDVLAGLGPFPATASHIITIDRPGVAQPLVVDLGTDPERSKLANIPVFPGDTIITSRVGIVYVLGEFKTTGSIPLSGNTPLTLLQVAALSGGANFPAKMHELRIIRTVGDRRTLVNIDYRKVLQGKAPDPILQNDDILYLPTSTARELLSNGSINTLFSTVSLLISIISYTR